MKMLRKIIDGKSLEISQENIYERVSFSKVFSKVLNYSAQTATLLLRFFITDTFLEYVPKTSFLKKQYFE